VPELLAFALHENNGPVTGGAVAAFAINNWVMGAQLASDATDTHGNFTMSLGNYSGPIMLQMYGGQYADLATGIIMSMNWGNVMTAVIPSITRIRRVEFGHYRSIKTSASSVTLSFFIRLMCVSE
jgi:hypothetical protein